MSGLSPVGRRQEGGGRNTGDDDGSGGSGNEADGEDVDDGERRDEENAWGRDGRREEGGSGYEGENHSRRTSLTRDDNMFASNNTVLLDSGFCTGAGMGAVNHELEMMNGGGEMESQMVFFVCRTRLRVRSCRGGQSPASSFPDNSLG